jgi:hypothetical protein
MLPIDGAICSLLHRLRAIDVSAGTVCLCHSNHVDAPNIAANHCHDVGHVGAVHGDTVASAFEAVEHQQQQVHPLLGGDGVLVCFVQIPVRRSAENANVQFVLPKVAVRYCQRVDCPASANGLRIWPLRDGAVVPAHNTALVEG